MVDKKLLGIFLLIFLIGLSAGCGQKEYVVEYGIGGYVYLPGQAWDAEGIESVKAAGDYLYFTQKTSKETRIERVLLASFVSGEDKAAFHNNAVLMTLKDEAVPVPEGPMEQIDFLSLLSEKDENEQGGTGDGKKAFRFHFGDFAIDQEQNLYYYMDLFIGENYSMESAGGLICRQTAEGEKVYCVYLPEILDIAVDGEGRAYALTGDGIQVLAQNGSVLGKIPTDEYHNEGEFVRQELFMDLEGTVYYGINDANALGGTYEIVWGKETPLKEVENFLGKYTYHFAAPEGKVLLYSQSSNNVLYAYRQKDGIQELLRWPDSGLMSLNVDWVVQAAPETLLVGYEGSAYQLNRTPVEELPERETLVIASVNGGSYSLQKAVMEFNAESTAYRIVLDDYGAYYSDQEGGWVCPQLDASLVSASPPDILDLQMLNLPKYAGKEMLEDLTPYLEKSEALDKGDYLDNMLEGMTVNGRLVCIPKTIQVKGIAGRSAWVEKTQDGWTMEALYRLSEEYPNSGAGLVNDGYGSGKERTYLLEEFCSAYYLEKFIDWENWTCDFDCDEFRELLFWAGRYGSKADTADTDGEDGGWTQYVPEEALLVTVNDLDFYTFFYLEIQCGEEICLTGFPTVDGKGRFQASVRNALAIASGSDSKDAAWEFLEYFLASPDRDAFSAFAMPAEKTEILKRYKSAVTPTYAKGTSGIMEAKSIRLVADQWVSYYMTPQDQADAILHAIETADFAPMSEEEEMIVRIVAEEAESYYSGDKSLEEVTGIIQNRAQLVLDERKG